MRQNTIGIGFTSEWFSLIQSWIELRQNPKQTQVTFDTQLKPALKDLYNNMYSRWLLSQSPGLYQIPCYLGLKPITLG